MSANRGQTKNLKLVPRTLEEVRAMVEAMTPSEKAQLSVDWLALLRASTSADPWTHGFSLVHRDSDTAVGMCGFKGPPDADGMERQSSRGSGAHASGTERLDAGPDQVRFKSHWGGDRPRRRVGVEMGKGH